MLFSVIRDIMRGAPVDPMSILMQLLAVAFIIFCVLPLHEFAHGWVAYKLGDGTAKAQGRLTMNPLASIDPMGSLAILLFGIGWAKPVPVNSFNFRNRKRDMAITALAGPVSNLLASLVGALLLNALYVFGGGMSDTLFMLLYIFLFYYIIINISLAAFNLIPLPPLDGSRILAAFLSDRATYKFYQYQRYIMLGVFLVIFTGVLDRPLAFLNDAIYSGVMWLASLPFLPFR